MSQQEETQDRENAPDTKPGGDKQQEPIDLQPDQVKQDGAEVDALAKDAEQKANQEKLEVDREQQMGVAEGEYVAPDKAQTVELAPQVEEAREIQLDQNNVNQGEQVVNKNQEELEEQQRKEEQVVETGGDRQLVEEEKPVGDLQKGIEEVVKLQEQYDQAVGQVNTQIEGEVIGTQSPADQGVPPGLSSRAQNLREEDNQRTAEFSQEPVAPLTQSAASHPAKSAHLAPSLEIATAPEQRRVFNSSLTTPHNQIATSNSKDRSEAAVGKTPASIVPSATPRGLEQGITEVLSNLERTMQSYEQKLGEPSVANNAGTGRRGRTPPSDLVSHQRPGSRTSTSTNYDPEKQKKLQAIMKRIKHDIGQMKEALDEEKTSQIPRTDSQASPSQESRPIDLRSRQESRGRRQHSSSQISQLNNLMRVGQNAVPSGSHFVPEADGALTAKRMKTLKSIFDFYSRQHLNVGRSATFEKIERNMQRLSLGEYMKFVADFKILQEYDMLQQDIKSACTSAFKAVAENKRDIDFFMFKASLYIVFRIEDAVPGQRGEDESQQEKAEQLNKKLTFGQQPLMITDGRSQGSAPRNKDLEEVASKKGFENPPLFDLQDKELIEERIAAALFLDKPSQVNLIQQGFMVPFHMRDAKRHSPEKQIQPKINVKTVELTYIEKEAIRLRIKAMKIERELNRPQVNMDKTEQAHRPIRDTFQKLKLPDEKKLKKALAKVLKELEQFEAKHPVEIRALEEKMANKQKMYEKVDGQTARSRRLENIQEEYSMTGGDGGKSHGDYLAIQDHQEDGHDSAQNGELYTVPEVDSARFQQPAQSRSRSPGQKKNGQEDTDEVTLQEPMHNGEKEMEANVLVQEQEEEKSEEAEPIPEDVTGYYTLEALTQVKDYQQLNKIIDIVREKNKEQKWSPGGRLPANPYESPHHGNGSLKLADASQHPSHSIISLDLDHGPAVQEVPRRSDLLQTQEPEKNLEEEEETQHFPEVTEAVQRPSIDGQEVSNYYGRNEPVDQNQSIFRPSLIGLDDNNQFAEVTPSQLLRQNSKPEVVYNNQLAVQSQEQQPFERMRASRMNLLNASMRDQNQDHPMGAVTSQRQRNQPRGNVGEIRLNLYNQDDFLNADLQLNPDQQEYRENNATFNTLPAGQEGGDYFATLQQNQPSTQRALLDQENEAMLRNAPQYRDMRSRMVSHQPILKASPRNVRGSSRQSKFTASNGTSEMPMERQRDNRSQHTNIGQRQDPFLGHRGLQPSASANLMNSDEISNEKIAREFLESHRRMQQEQRRLDHQYNRIKVELDHDTQQYNKFNMQPVHEVQGPQYRNSNEIVYAAGGAYTSDRKPQQVQRALKKDVPSNKNISRSHKKASHNAQAPPPNRRLEKRIYQVNDLKQMGILKNSQNNQSESNLRLPAIETATLPAPDFVDDGRAYPHSSLPIINHSISTSASAYNVLGQGSQSQGAIGPPQQYHQAYAALSSNRHAGSSEGPPRTLDASAAPIFHQRKNTKPSRSQMSSLKQPAQRRQKGERGPPQSQLRQADKLTPERMRVNKSQRRVEDRKGYISIQQQTNNEKQRRTDRGESKEATSVATRESMDALERDRLTRQQAATAMQEVYHAGLERNKLNLGPLLRNDQHRRLPSKEQVELRSSLVGNSKDYEYDLPKKPKSIFSVHNQSLANPRAQLRGGPQKNESLHLNYQRPGNGNEYIYEDLGEPRDAQQNYTINQSASSMSQHQKQQRATRYSQSKQGPGGQGKPPRQGPPSSLGHASGTRQAQSYAQLARNAKQRKATIHHDDYAHLAPVPRLSSTSLSKKAATLNDDLGSEYDRTIAFNQSYQPSPHYARHATDSRSEIPTHQVLQQSQQYSKIPALRRPNEPLRAGYPQLPAAPQHQQQQSAHLQHKQRLKNMRTLANSVESRTQRPRPHPSETVGNYSALSGAANRYYNGAGGYDNY